MRRLVVHVLLVAGCASPEAPSVFSVPPRIQALTGLSDLTATAYPVPKGGERGSGIELDRDSDGVSFTGFVNLNPGTYTIEVVFIGMLDMEVMFPDTPDVVELSFSDPVFLGRWVSIEFTVEEGEISDVKFNSLLDTIGRPGDGGDNDNDGLGLLDEILWRTDLDLPDTDEDGVLDGDDCDPLDRDESFQILPGGNVYDCDGDGLFRQDLPDWLGYAGSDCNDRVANIGACTGLTILSVTKSHDPMGCHGRIEISAASPAGVFGNTVWGNFLGGSGSTPPYLQFMDLGNGNFISDPLALAVAYGSWPWQIEQTVQLVAFGYDGKSMMMEMTFNIDFDLPTLELSPKIVTPPSFAITATATSPNQPTTLELWVAPLQNLNYIGTPQLVETAEAQIHTFQVDLATLGLDPGSYTAYVVVEDNVGNRLQPTAGSTVMTAGPFLDGHTATSDFTCFEQLWEKYPSMPMLRFEWDPNGLLQPTMRTLLQPALSFAATQDPSAELVSIGSLGVRSDGRVHLETPADYMARWIFTFYDSNTQTGFELQWVTAETLAGGQNPLIFPNNDPYSKTGLDPDNLPDSDVIASLYESGQDCDPLDTHTTGNTLMSYDAYSGEAVTVQFLDGPDVWRVSLSNLNNPTVNCVP